MNIKRKDLVALKVKAKEYVRPMRRLSVSERYRNNKYNSVKIFITDKNNMDRVTRRYKVTLSGPRAGMLRIVSRGYTTERSQRLRSRRKGLRALILELERVIGRKIHELCGEGKEGLKRVISKYKGIGGVYAMINLKNNKVYVGSSSDLSARFRFYVSRIKINPKMIKDTERGWDGFIIVIVLKEDDKTRREKEEYSIIRKVLISSRFTIYNVFVRKEDKERYGEKVML